MANGLLTGATAPTKARARLVPPLPPPAATAAFNQRPAPPLANGLLLMALVPARAFARPTSRTAVLALARPILARAPLATIILLTATVPEAVLATLSPLRAGVARRQSQPTRQSATPLLRAQAFLPTALAGQSPMWDLTFPV